MWSHSIYSSLVTGSDDFVGKIAYSIYKQKKLDWIEVYKKGHDGRYPTPEELDANFYPHYDSPKDIQDLRALAEAELNNFIKITLSEQLREDREEILKDEILKSVKASFLSRLFDGVIAGILTAAFLTIISLGFWLYDKKESDHDYQGPIDQAKEILVPDKKS